MYMLNKVAMLRGEGGLCGEVVDGQDVFLSDDQVEKFVSVRRDIHAHPELAYKESRTAGVVADLLRGFGYEVTEGIGVTGVVGQLKNGEGRSLGLRADMDALPILEESGVDYESVHKGVMHACGHDGHTAMLLAGAEVLARRKNFKGTLNLIFQPAEEGMAGAKMMIEEGLFERFPCDAVYGIHNFPGHKTGSFVFREGPFMASSDQVVISIEGVGGHGALPSEARDPVMAASQIVVALQSIVSRNVDPREPAVITVGSIHGGETFNVIPRVVELKLTVRAFSKEVRALLRERIESLVALQAESFGLKAVIDYRSGYPVTVNEPQATEFARGVARDLVGAENVVDQGELITGSEDFSYMLEQVPGSYLLIGNGDDTESKGVCMVHNSGYDFNDLNIPVGGAYWVRLAERFLPIGI